MEKKPNAKYTRMLREILNKSWKQHPTEQKQYGHLPAIKKFTQVRRTRHAGHCWRSKDELISDVLLWTPSHRKAKAGRLAWTYIEQICADTGCIPEDLPEVMDDSEEWRERVPADGATLWWPWWWFRSLLFSVFLGLFLFYFYLYIIRHNGKIHERLNSSGFFFVFFLVINNRPVLLIGDCLSDCKS